jgi:hypothetical protein
MALVGRGLPQSFPVFITRFPGKTPGGHNWPMILVYLHSLPACNGKSRKVYFNINVFILASTIS